MRLGRLTRRTALGAAVATGWSLFWGCSRPQQQDLASVGASESAETSLTATAQERTAEAKRREASPAQPTLLPPDPKPARPEPREIHIPYAVIVSRKLQVRSVSYDEAIGLWQGDIPNWGQLGDPLDPPVRRYTLSNSVLPIDPFGGDVSVEDFDQLAEALWNDRGGIALVPTRMVDFRVRSLFIDGVDFLRQPESPNPLTLELYGVPEDIAPESLEPRSPTAMLTFVGDIIFGRFVHKALEARGDFAASFRSIADDLIVGDLTIGDLECVLSDRFPQPENEDPQTFLFKTWTEAVSGLQLADIDILARANNHSFNFGVTGMQDTTDALDAAGIQHFGMGHTLDEARKPVIARVGDLSFALHGYNGISDQWDGATPASAGTAPLVEKYVVEDIEAAVTDGHIVIPYFHWGTEYVALPTSQQRRLAHVAIDAGAAIVIGSHPHWVQAVETYKDKPIIYSLGNFVFDQAWSRETMEGMFANVWFEGSTVKLLDLIPVLIEEEHRPRRMSEAEALSVLNRVWDATEDVRGWI